MSSIKEALIEHNETCDDEKCQECCEHGEYDHGICLNCDKDCYDDLVGQAEWAYDAWKDGE